MVSTSYVLICVFIVVFPLGHDAQCKRFDRPRSACPHQSHAHSPLLVSGSWTVGSQIWRMCNSGMARASSRPPSSPPLPPLSLLSVAPSWAFIGAAFASWSAHRKGGPYMRADGVRFERKPLPHADPTLNFGVHSGPSFPSWSLLRLLSAGLASLFRTLCFDQHHVFSLRIERVKR